MTEDNIITNITDKTTEKPAFDWVKWSMYDPEAHKAADAKEIAPGVSVLKIKERGERAMERKLEAGDTATFDFIARYSKAGEYDAWGDKARGVRWDVGRTSLIPALECVLSQMLPGERALCWSEPGRAYGVAGDLGGKAVLFEVGLTGISYRKVRLDDRDLTDADRLAEARNARAAGRSQLEKKPVAHKAALREFNRALQLLDQIVIDEDEAACGLAAEVAEEKFFLHLNDAYVYILRTKTGVASEWRKAVEHALAAVEVQGDPAAPESVRGNAKAQYRLGCAYLGMGDAMRARAAAERAAAMAPGDKAVAKLVADVEALQRDLDKTSPFLGMFNKK